MDAREELKQLSNGESQYMFLDRSNHSVTAFHPKPDTHLDNSDRLKYMGIDSLEKARIERTNSLVLEMMGGESSELSGISDEDSDDKSDAGSSSRRVSDAATVEELSDDEGCFDYIFNDEGVKKKLEILARMVGIECTQPGLVLDEVVRVLKDLERERGWYGSEDN